MVPLGTNGEHVSMLDIHEQMAAALLISESLCFRASLAWAEESSERNTVFFFFLTFTGCLGQINLKAGTQGTALFLKTVEDWGFCGLRGGLLRSLCFFPHLAELGAWLNQSRGQRRPDGESGNQIWFWVISLTCYPPEQ